MHIFNTRDERRVFGNLFDSISAIMHHVVSRLLSYYCTKEKAKIVQFYFETRSAVLTQRRFRAHKVKIAFPGTLSFLLLYIRGGSVSNLQKSFLGRKKWIRTAEKVQTLCMLGKNDPKVPPTPRERINYERKLFTLGNYVIFN